MSGILGVIPARLNSTRLERKLLLKLMDKPIIQWAYEGAKESRLLSRLVVATDAEEIKDACKNFGADVFLTPSNFNSGTERVAYISSLFPEYEFVINIQGDEPLIRGHLIDTLVESLINPPYPEISTLAEVVESEDEIKSPDKVKVVLRSDGFAIYFSRLPIPFGNGKKLKHIGIYGYTREALQKFSSLPPSELEKSEKLEQLRAIQAGIRIFVRVLPKPSGLISLDTEKDYQLLKERFGEV